MASTIRAIQLRHGRGAGTRHYRGFDPEPSAAATGQTIKGWLAPALTHTTRTLDLIAEYGLSYTCDLYHDDQPDADQRSPTGRLISMPYSLEVNDHYGFFVYNMSPRDYADTLIRQFERLAVRRRAVRER